MPRPGEVTSRQPSGSDYGSTAALQRLDTAVPNQPPQQQPAGPMPPPPPQGGDVSVQMTPQPQGDVTGGFDSAMVPPTDNPAIPLTHGMPFGPGANFVPTPDEDDREFMLRVANTLQSQPTTQRVKNFADRIRLGE